ncbi:hypothetical protein D0N37_16490 [Pseudoalteromonas piscicida]|nr:hypothetical protein D0N37_16490 [Pseudoalteromonas piscicida]
MLKMRKNLLNLEVASSLYFTLYGIFLHFNPESIDHSKIEILYFLTPLFFAYFIYSLTRSFKSYKTVSLSHDHLSLDENTIDMSEIEFVKIDIIYAFESIGWIRKVEVYYKYIDGKYCYFSGFYKLNLNYKELTNLYKENHKITIEKSS